MDILLEHWHSAQWLIYGAGGLGLFGWYSRSLKLALAAAGVVALVMIAGVIYHKGELAKEAEVLANTERLNKVAIDGYQKQKQVDDAELKQLRQQVADTPPALDPKRIAISAERAKRIGAIR